MKLNDKAVAVLQEVADRMNRSLDHEIETGEIDSVPYHICINISEVLYNNEGLRPWYQWSKESQALETELRDAVRAGIEYYFNFDQWLYTTLRSCGGNVHLCERIEIQSRQATPIIMQMARIAWVEKMIHDREIL